MPNKNSLFIKFFSPGFPGGSADKNSACNAGDLSSIPGLGRSAGEAYGNPLQYSCQENSMDYHGVAESQTGLSDFHFHFHFLCQIRVVLSLHLCSITHLKSISCLKANSTKIDPNREISELSFIYKLKTPDHVSCEEETWK